MGLNQEMHIVYFHQIKSRKKNGGGQKMKRRNDGENNGVFGIFF